MSDTPAAYRVIQHVNDRPRRVGYANLGPSARNVARAEVLGRIQSMDAEGRPLHDDGALANRGAVVITTSRNICSVIASARGAPTRDKAWREAGGGNDPRVFPPP